MTKQLSEMSLEELWQLFPISLTEHQTEWAQWYEEEVQVVRSALGKEIISRISHVGSTAVKGIWAKPVVDILIEIPAGTSMDSVKDVLTECGYIIMSADKKRISFNKGYTEKGYAEKVFHLHLRYRGDNDELYFRDYLNQYPAAAKQYEALKLTLWERYEHDREAYTTAKTEFVSEWTRKAKEEYGNKYK